MKRNHILFIAFSLTLSTPAAMAQDVTRFTTVTVSSEPSNEDLGIEKEVTRGWICYSGGSGQLLSECTVSFRLFESTQPLDINGVTNDCVYQPDGRVQSLTCGNGGHNHDLSTRPVIFPGTKVRYSTSDTDGADLTVTDEPSTTALFDGFKWTVPQVGGYYKFELSMLPGGNSKFVTFSNGFLFLWDKFQANGIAQVGFLSLKRLPDDNVTYYSKGRNPDVDHLDAVAYAAQDITIRALRAVGQTYKNNTNSLLSYNDISLPFGGIFEVRPGQFPWVKGTIGHKSHRNGFDVDINKPNRERCDMNTSVQTAVDAVLRDNPSNPDPLSSSALLCEITRSGFPLNPGNYHIDVTSIKRISGFPPPIVNP